MHNVIKVVPEHILYTRKMKLSFIVLYATSLDVQCDNATYRSLHLTSKKLPRPFLR